MTSTLLEEPLSLDLLDEEVAREEVRLQDSPVKVRGGHAKLMLDRLRTSCETLLHHKEVITNRDAVAACMAAVPTALYSVQHLVELLGGPAGSGGGEAVHRDVSPTRSTTAAEAMREVTGSRELAQWVAWIEHLHFLPHLCASSVAVRLPAVLAAMHTARHTEPCCSILDRAVDATRQLLIVASQTFPASVHRKCLPLHSLLPPWSVLTTAAQYMWTWERLSVLCDGEEGGSSGTGDVLSLHHGVLEAFRAVQERVELAYADLISREVLLYSFDAINWKTGNAVAAVKSVAPTTWFLFLQCRSLALHRQTAGSAQHAHCGAPAYFADAAARRLVARVLHRAVNDVRWCLARNASDMHGDRLEQLSTHDVPCLVLMTRLWHAYLQPHPPLAAALHASLVRLVNTAVELRNPLTVDEATIMVDAEMDKGGSGDTPRMSEVAARGRETERAGRFLDVVWNVSPLDEGEIAMSGAAVPWGASFPRATAVEAILSGHVVVTTVD